ncbi:MAG: hypothetical protein AVDCRST_MAG65-875 [uncultured Solirubrobacteraceae bacterium]|uniref:Uncharacterized protein n=1 Tax=uncultured Solirubrobacteraceae bacterium TaxID=1162706 RepID=A0A6J4RG43_9ACTN|nr:MAG: hypothetical protein AVDCRST_MAG65-875 [uncultured Solirubrobacteraceae bacterium]
MASQNCPDGETRLARKETVATCASPAGTDRAGLETPASTS